MADIKEIPEYILTDGMVAHYKGEVDSEGKPHGQGKAYYKSSSMYDGAWVNGKRQGYGIEYYPDGTTRYDGEWSGGLRHGKGKSFHTNGTLAFEGNWVEDKPINYPTMG